MPQARQVVREASLISNEALARIASQCEGIVARSHEAVASRGLCDAGYLVSSSGKSLEAAICRATDLSGTEAEVAIMSLLETNMRSHYESSQQGWNYKEKKDELFDDDARFLIVRVQTSNDTLRPLAAFVNWRFDVEECEEDDPCKRAREDVIEVAYCYEVQVAEPYRKEKLGTQLMSMLELIAKHTHMRKVMLTAFLSNTAALGFYDKRGYRIDMISPSQYETEEGMPPADYEIMSKVISWK